MMTTEKIELETEKTEETKPGFILFRKKWNERYYQEYQDFRKDKEVRKKLLTAIASEFDITLQTAQEWLILLDFDKFRKRWNKGEYRGQYKGRDCVLYTSIAKDFDISNHTAQRWVLRAEKMIVLAEEKQRKKEAGDNTKEDNTKNKDRKRKTRAELTEIFNRMKSEGITGKPILQVASEYGISHITAKKFIDIINTGGTYGVIPRKKTKVLLLSKASSEKISDWPLMKINVSPDVKGDYDHLPDRLRKQLFFNADKSISKLNIDQLPEAEKVDGVTSYHQIYIRVSPESLTKWRDLPADFKKNLWIDQLIANLCHSMLE